MDLSPVFEELEKQTPCREVVIEELDKVTDSLRGGYPTTERIDELFDLFTKLIRFNQWHIQQYTLSCTKYIFENSTLTNEEKFAKLLDHRDFTEQCGILLSNPKREVREMSAQCIGQLAIQFGPAILEESLGLSKHVFQPEKTHFAIEGQQMVLGRLSTAFRIKSVESLVLLFKSITNDDELNVLENESENGYGFWYSTRALYLFVTDKIDVTLSKHKKQFEESRKFVLDNFKQQILDCAIARLSHRYANARRSAAAVVASVFKAISGEEREGFILSLLPTENNKWVQREGRLLAIANCLDVAEAPFSAQFAEDLCKKLLELAKDPIACDEAPITQKGNANAMAAKALVKILRLHDHALYKKYIHGKVVEFLRSPVAALLDGGVICTAELKQRGIPVTDLILLMFKDICHTSFPIRDLARRTINVKEVVSNNLEELINTILSFAGSEDNEVRECTAKALQLVATNTNIEELPDSVTECGIKLAQDPVDTVQAAAVELIRVCLTADSAAIAIELVMPLLDGESEEATLAAIRLLKDAIRKFPESVNGIAAPSPILAFLSLSSMSSPVISAAAQQLLFMIAGQEAEVDEDVIDRFNDIDAESADVSEYEEFVGEALENPALAATFLAAVLRRFSEEIDQSLEELPVIKLSELDLSNKETSVKQISYIIKHIDELNAEEEKKALQALADVFADEAIEDKKLLLLALESIRCIRKIEIPDPTPFSLAHDSETFADNNE
jgi:hypothetical protein